MVVSGRLAANIGRARGPAGLSAVEKNGRGGGEKNFTERGAGECASGGADPAAAPHQCPGSARVGSRFAEVEIVNGNSTVESAVGAGRNHMHGLRMHSVSS